MLALLTALAVAQQAPCDARLCNPDALAPVFEKLRAQAPVHILQIGDSHTAGDAITGAWRARLQARHGFGGRGVLAAGRPYAGYRTRGVTASQSGGWSVNALFGPRYWSMGPPLGLTGLTQSAHASGEVLAVSADTPDQSFDRIIACAVAGPDGAALVLRMGASEERWALDGPACRTMDSEAPVSAASITTGDDRAVAVASFATFRRAGGVVLSNLGVVGAQLVHLARADEALVRAELAAWRPDLIVLAFGTNEGFSGSLAPDAYEAGLRARIERIRALAGEAVPILLLGPPDAAARRPGEACGGGWSVPRLLGQVRERQRAVARDVGLAFWDWSAAMGGRCASYIWQRAGLMRADHVHFTPGGGDRIGAMIDADIEAAGR